jgi:chaperone modulatory protein CbpM
MVEIHEILLRARLDAVSLEAWVEAGWLSPRGGTAGQRFSELDVARACLIRDLREDLGINDEGIPVVLDLVDQVHGLRQALRRLALAMQALPEPVRHEAFHAAEDSPAESDNEPPASVAP